jgi:hypothetical protein
MYPFLRMTLLIRSEARKPPLGIFDRTRGPCSACPLDADMFWEMNNGRILTFYDLGRFGLAQRIGLIADAEGTGLGPRRRGKLGALSRAYPAVSKVRTQDAASGWDARFFYIEQAMWRGGHGLQPRAVAHRRDREGKIGANGARGRGDELSPRLAAATRLGE